MSLSALILVPIVVCASGTGAPVEAWEARFQAGLSSRSGRWQAPGRALTYDGLSLESGAVRGWAWLLFDVVGLAAALELDAFGVFDQGVRVASVRLVRAHLGPTARLRLGPLRLEALVGYALHTLPAFDTDEPSTLTAPMRHSVVVGARALVDLGPVTMEGRFEAPLPSGYSVGGGVRMTVARTGALVWRLLAEGASSVDSYANAVGLQQVVRAGVGLDLAWQALPEVLHTGAVRVSVSTDDGERLMEQELSMETVAGPVRVRLDAQGTAWLRDVETGPVSATLRVDGYEPATARAEVVAGGEVSVEIALTRVRSGTLLVTVRDEETHTPVAGALVTCGTATLRTNDVGQVTLTDLAPGATAVEVSAEARTSANEAAMVVAGRSTNLEIELRSEKRREPATLRGLVRSSRGGAPISATLVLAETKTVVTADASGAFRFSLPAGRYSITISAKGFRPQTRRLVLQDAEHAILNVDLQPK